MIGIFLSPAKTKLVTTSAQNHNLDTACDTIWTQPGLRSDLERPFPPSEKCLCWSEEANRENITTFPDLHGILKTRGTMWVLAHIVQETSEGTSWLLYRNYITQKKKTKHNKQTQILISPSEGQYAKAQLKLSHTDTRYFIFLLGNEFLCVYFICTWAPKSCYHFLLL